MKTHELVSQCLLDTHFHCRSGSSWVMEPLSVCAEKALVHQGQNHFFGETCETWDAFLQRSPGVNICFPLASSGSVALLSGWSRLCDTPCCIFLPLGPAFPVVKFGNFHLKKNQNCTRERGPLSICETEQLLVERHMVSLSTGCIPTGWLDVVGSSQMLGGLAFHRLPVSPVACVLLHCSCYTPSCSHFLF